MGRKRKTRWRRLSIGETSGNEEEGEDLAGAVGTLTRSLSSSQNHSPARGHPEKSLHHHNSSSAIMTKGSNNASTSLHNSSNSLSNGTSTTMINGSMGDPNSPKKSGTANSSNAMVNGDKNGDNNSSGSTTSSGPSSTGHGGGGSGGYHSGYNGHTNYHHQHYNNHHYDSPSSHYDRYHYHKDNYRPPSYYNNYSERSERGGYHGRGDHHNSHHNKEYHSGGYHSHGGYHGSGGGSNYYRNGYNSYRNTHYNAANGSSTNSNSNAAAGGATTNGGSAAASDGYNNGGGGGSSGGGASDYHHSYPHHPSSRPYGNGRFRRSRSYPASNYYYANGSSHPSGGAANNCDNTNKPSYNQDEYTKITTPRQDVLFKKGYLTQKKSQSSSVDSVSTTTTPSASNNGTPDTQSTNGINSDYSEGYENGETDCVIPYDDAYYYGPPPEAVFTDPNTGQVYYGHCSSSGEYYDAYPVSPMMVAGYPTAVYYPVPYPIDWNGVAAAPMYPTVVAVPPPPNPLEEPLTDLGSCLQGEELTGNELQMAKSDTVSSSPSGELSLQSQQPPPLLENGGEIEQEPPNSSSSSSSSTENHPVDSSSSSSHSQPETKKSSSLSTTKSRESESPPKGEKSLAVVVSKEGDNNNSSSKSSQKKVGESRKSDVTLSSSSKQSTNNNNTKKEDPSSSSCPSSSTMSSASSTTSSAPVSPPGGTGSAMPNTTMTPSSGQVPVAQATIIATTVPLPLPHPTHHNNQQQQHYSHPRHHHNNNNNNPSGPPMQQHQMNHHHLNNHHIHGPPLQPSYHGPPPPHQLQQHHSLPPPPHPMALGGPPPPGPLPPQFHHHHNMYPPPLPHPPHPGFVYGPPVYNGVVVPIAPVAASAAASASSSLSTIEIDTVSSSPSSSRKKRKKRRREKEGQDHDDDDDGQLTDEVSSDDSTLTQSKSSLEEEQEEVQNPNDPTTKTTDAATKDLIKSSNSTKSIEILDAETAPKTTSVPSATLKINTSSTNNKGLNKDKSNNYDQLKSKAPTPPREKPLLKQIISKDIETSAGKANNNTSSSSSSSISQESQSGETSSNDSSPSKSKVAVRKDISLFLEEESTLSLSQGVKDEEEEEEDTWTTVTSKKGKSKYNKKSHHSTYSYNNYHNNIKISREEDRQKPKSKSTMDGNDDEQTQKTKASSSVAENKKSNEESTSASTTSTTSESNTNVEDNVGSNTRSKPLSSSSSSSSEKNETFTTTKAPTTTTMSSTSHNNKKPTDLTVQCSPTSATTSITEDFESPFSPISPDIFPLLLGPNNNNTADEPSSPDSLNTTQSMAGSEIAGVENLSVSESELLMMNRTASIDEVEEDLPSDLALSASVTSTASTVIHHYQEDQVDHLAEEPSTAGSDFALEEEHEIIGEGTAVVEIKEDSCQRQCQPVTNLEVPEEAVQDESETIDVAPATTPTTTTPVTSIIASASGEMETIEESKKAGLSVHECKPIQPEVLKEEFVSMSSPAEKSDLDSEEISSVVEEKVEAKATQLEPSEVVVLPSEEIISSTQGESPSEHEQPLTDLGQLESQSEPRIIEEESGAVTTTTFTTTASASSTSTDTKERPKSITLAVSEWLKTQGDDALTPIVHSGPSRSLSSEDEDNEGDIDDSDYEYDDDYGDGGGGGGNPPQGEKDAKKPSELSQNQKNVYGNPWVAPSNKSGNTKSRKSSSSCRKVSGADRKNINHQDGVGSRVALSNAQHLQQQQNSNRDQGTKPIINYDSGLELSSPESNSNTSTTKATKGNKDSKSIFKKSEEDLTFDYSTDTTSPTKTGTSVSCSCSSSKKSSISYPASSLDERDHLEICDPQKFAHYYQFGVVFDRDENQDQGIETEGDDEDDSLEEITLHNDEVDTTLGKSQDQDDFLQVMMRRNKSLQRKVAVVGPTTNYSLTTATTSKETTASPPKHGTEVILRGFCDENDDEEIGTFDPKSLPRRLSCTTTTSTAVEDIEATTSAKVRKETNPSSPSQHLYVNPMSLAKELVESSSTTGEPLSDSWDVESEPLPEYQPPSPAEFPVYNHLTPQAKVIRKKLQAVGGSDPISSTICCSIQ